MHRRTRRRFGVQIVAGFLILATVIGVIGLSYHRDERRSVYDQAHKQLTAIADSKSAQIADWLQERYGDCRLTTSNSLILPELHRVALGTANQATLSGAQGWLGGYVSTYAYEQATLLDTSGVAHVSAGRVAPKQPLPPEFLARVLQTREAMLQDLHFTSSGDIRLGFAIALRESPSEPAFAVLFLQVDPAKFLYPAVRSWPINSPTAEAVLVRRDGTDALLLSNTRHQDNTALRQRIPLTRLDVPAVRAAQGGEFVMSGVDYRGVPTVAAARRIAGSPWSIVAKVDEYEVEQTLRDQTALLLVSLVSLLAASALLAILLWRRQYASLLKHRHHAQLESLRLRDSYDYLTRHANDIIILGDERLRIIEVNDRACSAYGYSREALLQMNASDLRDPSFRPDIEQQAQLVRDAGGAIYETRARHSDGSTFPIEVSSRSFRAGGKLYFQAIVRDISERKDFEQQLHATNLRLRTLIDSAPVGIAAVDPGGIITLWNPAAERISGHPESKIIGSHYQAAPGFLDSIQPGHPMPVQDLRRLRGDGNPIVLSISTAPLGGSQGEFAGDIVMFADVTGQRRAAAASRQQDQYLEGLVTAAPMAILSVDRHRNIVTWNKGAEDLFGWSAAETIGRPSPAIPEELAPAASTGMEQLFAGSVVRNLESRRVRKDGTSFDSSADAAPIRNDQGEITGLVAFVQDVTARKLAEKARSESEAKFRTLFEEAGDAIVIHDPAGQILELNQAACTMMGAAREQLLGRTPPYLVAPSASTGGRSFFESVHRHADGTVTAIEVHTSLISLHGQPAALSVVRDISERKRLEEDLRQTNESLRTIIQTSPAAIVCRDTSARVLTWNRGAELVFGWTAAEAIGTTLPFIEDAEPELLQAICGRIRQGECMSGFEHQLNRRDGTPLRVSISTAPFHNPEGGIAGEIAIVLDVTTQQNALASLRESESRFRTVFDQAATGMALCDFEGRFSRVNRRFCELTGYSEEELLRLRAVDITHPDDRAREMELAYQLIRGELDTFSLEKRYIRRDGSAVWTRVTISLRRDPELGAAEIFGLIEDISARKEAESSRKLLADAISGSHEEIFLFDAETLLFRFANRSALRNLGYSSEQIATLTPVDITADATTESVRALLQPLRDARMPVLVTNLRQRRADGTTYPVEVHLQVFPDGDGQIALAVAQDISIRLHAEEVLRESEARFRAVVESSPVAIYILNDAIIRYLNPSALRLFGAASPDELVGLSIFERIHPDWHAAVKERLSELDTSTRALPWAERKHIRLDGTVFDTEVSAVPFVYEGKPSGLVFFQDISERKRQQAEHLHMEELLRQAQKMESIGRLAGGVAHDFNNHLTVIGGFSELVLDQVAPDSPFQQPLREIRKAGERAASLTRQLLAFSRKQILDPHPLDLGALVGDLSNMLRRLLREDIQFSTHLAPDVGLILADSSQMSQVLMNLCVNARDAMPKGGRLTVSTSACVTVSGAPGVRLTISDTGSGIDASTLPKIFEPFFTTKGPGIGTGLGLATVYGIVEQSGGVIEVESTAGVGSDFHLTFPAVPGATPAATAAATASPACGSEHILLVEDQFEVRLLAKEILTRFGYRVSDAAGGEEALAVAQGSTEQIDLLVTDVVMPGCSGTELAARFATLYPSIPVLFMTGYDAGMLDPGSAHIAKPFTPAALGAKVRERLDAIDGPARRRDPAPGGK